jgi:iron complex transport system permease protein
MNKLKAILLLLAVLVPVSLVVSASIGAMAIDLEAIASMVAGKAGISLPVAHSSQEAAVFWAIRLPRVLMSAFVGSSLAICGAAMQGLFRNPLADPSIIGISAGGALAASLVIVLAGSFLGTAYTIGTLSLLSIATFAGAAAATFLIFRIARKGGQTSVATMLLAGVAINALAGAFTGLMTYLADNEELRSLTFWTLGSLGGANWKNTAIVALTTVLATGFILPLYKPFNALALGEKEAIHIGIPTEVVKRRVIVLTALGVGATVAFCGMISFIGLVVPHMLRLWGSADHRFLLPASALGGAVLLCWADTLSRTVVAPAEIPIGIITSLAGAPFFLFLLVKYRSGVV